jgi:hypothetical protein
MTGLDTETIKGKAVLIATPRAFCEPWQWRGEDRFTLIVEWLRKQDKEGFVCWNADYDIQAILKWLPREIGERLQRFSRARYKDYRLRFVGGKFFTVHRGARRLVAIYDLMQFYACALKTAAEKYLQNETKTDPGIPWDKVGAVLKGSIAGLRVRFIDYCLNDARLVESLYRLSRAAMERIGVKFHRPVSCAAVASQKFGKGFSHTIPKDVNQQFEKTFRGGRMECRKLGFFPRAYLYDLHSAYPSEIAKLPSLPTIWEPIRGGELRPDAVFAAVRARVKIPHGLTVAPVPVPGEGQLIYPTGSWETWLDRESFRLLERRGWIVDVLGGFEGVFSKRRYPFDNIREMYQERIKTPANAWALKIVMNAWYGKLAQRIGKWKRTRIAAGPVDWWKGECWRREEHWTKKTCFVYASAITAGIRARLFSEVDPSKVIFYATDGIATTEPLPELKTGPGLGEWSDVETISDLLVVGSGVYSYRHSHGMVRTKFRGFDLGIDLYSLLDCRRAVVEMTVQRNVTLAHALSQKRWAEFNEIQAIPRFLDVNFDRKRLWEKPRTGRELLKRTFESEPWRYYGEVTF